MTSSVAVTCKDVLCVPPLGPHVVALLSGLGIECRNGVSITASGDHVVAFLEPIDEAKFIELCDAIAFRFDYEEGVLEGTFHSWSHETLPEGAFIMPKHSWSTCEIVDTPIQRKGYVYEKRTIQPPNFDAEKFGHITMGFVRGHGSFAIGFKDDEERLEYQLRYC